MPNPKIDLSISVDKLEKQLGNPGTVRRAVNKAIRDIAAGQAETLLQMAHRSVARSVDHAKEKAQD